MTETPTTVEDLMTAQPVSLDLQATVAEALAMLERYPFRHLPVEDGNRLVGIVSDRDLALSAALPRPPGKGGRTARKVEELMRAAVRTVAPETPLARAATILLDEGIGALPVVVPEQRLVGMLTCSDFLRLHVGRQVGPDGVVTEEAVSTLMSRPVLVAHPDEDLVDAAQRLFDSEVHHLPVVEGGELVGMLSDRDVRRGLARLAREDQNVEERGERRVPTLAVRQVLSKPCMSVGPRASLHAAAHTLLECRIGALPVVEGGEILGIVTQTDLLRRCLGGDA